MAMKAINNSLSNNDYVYLGNTAERYSAKDLLLLVKEASMIPVRWC